MTTTPKKKTLAAITTCLVTAIGLATPVYAINGDYYYDEGGCISASSDCTGIPDYMHPDIWVPTGQGYEVYVNKHNYFFGAYIEPSTSHNVSQNDLTSYAWPINFNERETTFGNDKVNIPVPSQWHRNDTTSSLTLTEKETALVTSLAGSIDDPDSRAAVSALVAYNWGQGTDTTTAIDTLFNEHKEVKALAEKYALIAQNWDENNLQYEVTIDNQNDEVSTRIGVRDGDYEDSPWVMGFHYNVDINPDTFTDNTSIWKGITPASEISQTTNVTLNDTHHIDTWNTTFDAYIAECLQTETSTYITPPGKPVGMSDDYYENKYKPLYQSNVDLVSNRCGGQPQHIHKEITGLNLPLTLPPLDINPPTNEDPNKASNPNHSNTSGTSSQPGTSNTTKPAPDTTDTNSPSEEENNTPSNPETNEPTDQDTLEPTSPDKEEPEATVPSTPDSENTETNEPKKPLDIAAGETENTEVAVTPESTTAAPQEDAQPTATSQSSNDQLPHTGTNTGLLTILAASALSLGVILTLIVRKQHSKR